MRTALRGGSTGGQKRVSVYRIVKESGRPYGTVYGVIRQLKLPSEKIKIPGHHKRVMGILVDDANKVMEQLAKTIVGNRAPRRSHKKNGATAAQEPTEIVAVPKIIPVGSRMDQIKQAIAWVQEMGFAEFHVVGNRATYKEMTVTEGEVSI